MNDYIHGYSSEEQQRLIHQAQFLEPQIYPWIDLAKVTHLLEIGCGVGAQTEILLRRYPQLKITGVDLEPKQIQVARERLARPIAEGRLVLEVADARNLAKLPSNEFDGAFLCWFLEHVPDPKAVLSEAKRLLKPKSQVWITEVNNSSLFIHPYSASFLKYWFEFNDYQWTHSGHPFVGLQLGAYLSETGFREVELNSCNLLYDQRDLKNRRAYIELFFNILKSANEKLIQDGRIGKDLIDEVRRDFTLSEQLAEGVFYYHFVQARAQV